MNENAKNPFGSAAVAQRLSASIQPPAGIESASTALAAQAKAMVESRYYMALARPRNWDQVRQDILKECRRPSFAHNKSTLYNKPIGKGVEGLGIRFTEMGLRCMTNVLVETNMIFEDDLKEVIRVSVTDLESNVTYPLDIRVSKTVERSKPQDDGSYISMRLNSWKKPVYTVAANDDDLLNKRGALISKAQRTLSLRIIPGDIQDEAEQIIRQIRMDEAAKDPDSERKKVADAFASLSVKATDLEEYLGHALDGCTPAELVDLRGLYGALKDGEATWQTVMENKRSLEEESAGSPAKHMSKTGAGALKDAITAGKGKEPAAPAVSTGDNAVTATATTGAPDAAVLTVVDYIAGLAKHSNEETMALWADGEVPSDVRSDEKFIKAYKQRLDAIKGKK